MKIVILGPAHPYRGGLATIMETMARTFQQEGHTVSVRTFTVQYPKLLFPGKSQTVDTPPPADLAIERCVNTTNPFNWIAVGRRLRREAPDILLLKYWTPFMAPCFGTIARLARRNGRTKVICQIDNVEPHEHHLTDRPFNRYFLRAVDGFIYMSEQVHGELRAYTRAPALFSPHPLFENFGSRVDRAAACAALGIDPSLRYALFFGLIRDYKGLDLLLEAWGQLRRGGGIGSDCRLLVAGEFYADPKPYRERMAQADIAGSVVLHDRFIPDAEVKNYFSAADFIVLPYRTATQSGITQIAYQFELPMIVTDVGGLPEIVPDGRAGRVVAPAAEPIAGALAELWQPGACDRYREQLKVEKRRFSWDEMCRRILELYRQL